MNSVNEEFKLTIFAAQSGAPSARLNHSDGRVRHIHSLVDPEREADFYSGLALWGQKIVLAGFGLGYHLARSYGTLSPDTRILLIEYYKELGERAFKSLPIAVQQQTTVISSETPQWQKVIDLFLGGGGIVQVVKHPASFHAQSDFYEKALRSVGPRELRSGLSHGGIVLMEGDFFLQQELHAAIRQEGKTVIPFHYKQWLNINEYESQLQKIFQELHPEALLSVNMLGFDGNGVLAEYTERLGIPVLVWFVDDPRPILLSQKASIRSTMVACTWERRYCGFLQQAGFSSVTYLPLATDPELFSRPSGLDRRYGCGFVGSSMGERFLADIATKFLWQPAFQVLAVAVANRLIVDPEYDVDFLTEDYLHQQGTKLPFSDDRNRTWLRSYVIHTASMIKRQRVIAAVEPLGVELFGDADGWRKLCGKQVKTHNAIDYRHELSRYYAAIDININITSLQMPTAVNQRVFDVPMSGSFLIADYQKDLDTLFATDELALYHSSEELSEKVVYFQRHKAERIAITNRARRRILQEHTYNHRFRTMMRLLQLH